VLALVTLFVEDTFSSLSVLFCVFTVLYILIFMSLWKLKESSYDTS